MQFKIIHVSNSFCRIVYECRNRQNERIYYCLQDNGSLSDSPGVTLYRCCSLFEPSHKAHAQRPLRELFELPTGMSDLCRKVRQFIQEN